MALSSFDRWIWRFVRRLSVRSRSAGPAIPAGTMPPGTDIRRILLVRTDKIGDVIVSTPIFEALRQRFPDAEIDMVLGRKNGAAAPLVPYLDRIFHASKRAPAILSLVRQIRQRRYDVAIDMLTGDSNTSMLYTALSGAKVTVGFGDRPSSIYDVPVPRPTAPEHEVIYLFRLLEPLGIGLPETSRLSIVLGPEVIEAARAALAPLRDDKRKLLAINISVVSERFWTEENFVRLAREFDTRDVQVIFIGAPSDLARLKRCAEAAGVAFVPPNADFAYIAGVIYFADILVTPDTSLVHIAAALNKPVVSLSLSRRVSDEWYGWGVPCRAVDCEEGVAHIPYGEVLAAVRDLMTETGIVVELIDSPKLSQRLS